VLNLNFAAKIGIAKGLAMKIYFKKVLKN